MVLFRLWFCCCFSPTHTLPNNSQFNIRPYSSSNHFRHSISCQKYCRHQRCILQKFLQVHLLFCLLESSRTSQQLQIKAKPFFCSDVCDTTQAGSSSIKDSSSSVQTCLEPNTSWLTSQNKHKFLNILAYHTFPGQPATLLIHLL